MSSIGDNVETPESGRTLRKKRKTCVNMEEIHCSVCDIWVMGVSQYGSHVQGGRHLKKAKEKAGDEVVSLMPFMRLNDTVRPHMYTCTACNVVLNSSLVALRHIVAARHVENMKGEPSETNVPLPSLSTEKMHVQEIEKMHVQDIEKMHVQDIEKMHVQDIEKILVQEPVTEMVVNSVPALLKCTVCDIKTNSETQLQQHLSSAKHKLRAAHMSRLPKPAGTLRRLQCDLCKVSANSVIQLNQHMESEKHKNNANPPPVPTEQLQTAEYQKGSFK